MCESLFGVLARVRQPMPTDFEGTARDAAGHGAEILGPLMLIARDSPDPLAVLCATKALALSPEPRAAEALRRVCGLPADARHPAVARVWAWDRPRIAAQTSPRLLGRHRVMDDGGRVWEAVAERTAELALAVDYTTVAEEPWEEAEFADGYYREMEDLTRQFGDPEWEEML